FTRVLYAIRVQVKPYIIAQGGSLMQPRVPSEVVLSGCERSSDRLPSGRIGVTIGGIIATQILRADGISRRWNKIYIVVTRDEIIELIETTTGCGCGRDDICIISVAG